eukprot:1183058-Prorocentrum_minimum.AAC.1
MSRWDTPKGLGLGHWVWVWARVWGSLLAQTGNTLQGFGFGFGLDGMFPRAEGCTCAANLRSHVIEKVGQIYDLRLLRSVLDDGLPLRARGPRQPMGLDTDIYDTRKALVGASNSRLTRCCLIRSSRSILQCPCRAPATRGGPRVGRAVAHEMRWHVHKDQMQATRVYSHDGPVRRRPHGYILMTDQSDAGHAGIFSWRTNQMQDTWVYSQCFGGCEIVKARSPLRVMGT